MTITEIKVRKLLATDPDSPTQKGRLKGIVSVTIDNCFAVHDIKVVQGDSRLFVAMPSRRDDSGVFRDIVHPISREMRDELESEILSAYHTALEAAQPPQPTA